ncbi:MAG: XRE family transcriptional regulator [Bacteroidetes bacterium]|nr:MAG: XRE family transcriptional regulator [Bacteroidota bacterium]
MKYARRIRLIRESRGLTQADVAYAIQITPSAYGQIERQAGKTKIETLEKIAEVLKVKLTFLIDLENPETKM